MIAEKSRNGIAVESTLTGQSIAMGIKAENMQHIMSLMIDMYGDPQMAVIREYSTNGRDAVVEAGGNAPIEVTTPTALSPFFKVKDSGIGLSVEDIHEIYSQYGSSTKRSTNDQVGMLGLGCKSALTYTNQFTVSSVKDGTRITVVVARDEAGRGSMQVVDTSTTADPNGTEVTIGVRREDVYSFGVKAVGFFKFWDAGTVLLNGEPPKRFEGLKVTDNIFIEQDTQNQHKIVMGNVAYPWVEDFGLARGSVIAYVDIGEVDFPPSREALALNDITKPTLTRIKAEFEAGLKDAVQKEIDAATSKPAAVAALRAWDSTLPLNLRNATYSYKGEEVPRALVHPALVAHLAAGGVNGNAPDNAAYILTSGTSTYRMGAHSKLGSIAMHECDRSYFVEGFALAGFAAAHKQKLQRYCTENSLGYPTNFILSNAKIDTAWVDSPTIIQWDDVKSIKLNRTINGTSTSGRIAGSYDMFIGETFKSGVPAADINTTNPVYYYRGNRYGAAAYLQVLAEFVPNFTVVLLQENRFAKFQRNFPAAQDIVRAVTDHKEAWLKAMKDDAKVALYLHDQDLHYAYLSLDPAKLRDPSIARIATLSRKDVTKDVKILQAFNRLLGRSRYRDPIIDIPWTDPLAPYPLYSDTHIGTTNEDHIYIYLNAAYAATTKEA